MDTQTNEDFYERGLKLAEAGSHQQALEYIERHISASPDDAEAINDAGAILHCLGRFDEAVEHFLRARRLNGDSAEIVWNLAEAYLAAGRDGDVIQLLDEIEQMDILNPDLLNRTANVCLNNNNSAGAIEMLLRSLEIAPDQRVLRPMIEVIRSKRPGIAFFCGADGMQFLNEIVEFTRHRFRVRVFEGNSEQQMRELMEWSDISWFEWCTNLAVIGSRIPKVCRNIVRLHRYEAYESWPKQVDWNNVDVLLTIGNSFVRNTLLTQVPNIENQTRIVTIPNGIDLDKFGFTDKPPGRNIAFLANLRMVKNPPFVLQCMQKLHYIDPQYRLFFAGRFQDPALEQYLRYMVRILGLEDVVFFDGWQDDVGAWLHDKHYIVSTSIIEGQGVGVLEAMACGLKPVVHNFPGADQILPPEFLFNISEDFCRLILDESYEPWQYRQFVEETYPLQKQLDEINAIFTGLEKQIYAAEMSLAG